MKKWLLILVFCMTLTIVSSCGEKPEKASGKYLFSVPDRVMYKYNVETGTRTPVCSDPLCKHDAESSCPFYGVGETVFQYGEKVVYYKDNELCEYNPADQSSKVLFRAKGNIFELNLIGNVVYFNSLLYDFSPDAEHPVSVDIIGFDLKSNTAKTLNNEPLYDIQRLDGERDGRLIWNDDGTHQVYSTDTEYRSREEYDELYCGIIAGSRSYRLELSKTEPLSFNVVGFEDGEKITALKDIALVKGYRDCLIATYNNSEGKYIGKYIDADGSEIQVHEYHSNNIFIYDQNGNNGKLLCVIPDDMIIYSFSPSLELDDKIGVLLKKYEYDESGMISGFRADDDIAIIDLNTGEVKVTRGF